jgi:hypothetical protein
MTDTTTEAVGIAEDLLLICPIMTEEHVILASALLPKAAAALNTLAARVKKLEDENARQFTAGYVLACCNMQHMHGAEDIAADVLGELRLTTTDLGALDLSEYDAKALSIIRRARNDDPILALTQKDKTRG